MKIKLLIRQKIEGEAGEIVEVSPDRAGFLIDNGAAVKADAGEQAKKPEATEPKKTEEPKALKKIAQEEPKTKAAKTAAKAPAKKKK